MRDLHQSGIDKANSGRTPTTAGEVTSYNRVIFDRQSRQVGEAKRLADELAKIGRSNPAPAPAPMPAPTTKTGGNDGDSFLFFVGLAFVFLIASGGPEEPAPVPVVKTSVMGAHFCKSTDSDVKLSYMIQEGHLPDGSKNIVHLNTAPHPYIKGKTIALHKIEEQSTSCEQAFNIIRNMPRP